jgi:uncharacterized protein (DUF1697 family)
MTTYIALLRGINVGGHNLIKMSELRRMFEEMGLSYVQTYIQSGNVLFQAQQAEEPLRQRIEHEIKVVFGVSVPIVLRTVVECKRIVRNCPFSAADLAAGESLYVSLLAELPSQEGINRLPTCNGESDEYRIRGREIYVLCRQSYHKSKLSNQYFEQKLRVSATSRNWQTINKLVDMGQAIEAGLRSSDQ